MTLRKLAVLLILPAALSVQAAELKQAKPATLKPAPGCIQDATRCYKNQFQQCRKGEWTVLRSCSQAQRCDARRGCVSRTMQTPQLRPQVPARQGPSMMAVPSVALPETDLSRRLSCPTVPNNTVSLPPPPYNETEGDCALQGKTAQVEAWLSDLERIASTCQARGERYWSNARNSYTDLGRQIDRLPLAPVHPPSDRAMAAEAMCPSYPRDIEPGRSADPMTPEGWHYTNWLKMIGERVVDYCEQVDKLIEPMYEACDEVNFYLDCQRTTEGRRSSYRRLLDGRWNGARLRYDASRSYYTEALQRTGWDNFRIYFNERYIRCGPGETSGEIPVTTPRRMMLPSR